MSAIKPTVINVPMRRGPRKRFAVHADGTVYELRRIGNLRVLQEPFRSQLVEMARREEARAADPAKAPKNVPTGGRLST